MSKNFKIALIQMSVQNDTSKNIEHAHLLCREASKNNADILVLPEIFSCTYDSKNFPKNAFDTESKHFENIRKIAIETKSYLIAGSIPEKYNDKIYNSSFVFDSNGNILARHRKVHLFDIDIKNGQKFKESDTLSAGDDVTVFETSYGKIGLMICYDIRFPEFTRMMVNKGAELIIVPAAFNMTTGPAHWELSFRARALDNQVFMLGCAPARNEKSSYVSFANSIACSPWGEVIAKAGTNEEILYVDINLNIEKEIREQLPLLKHRRLDIYK